MQISIDTAKDSKEDILKAIKLLESMINDGRVTSQCSRNIFDSSQPEVQSQGSVFGNFFDNVAKTDSIQIRKQSSPKIELY